MQIAYFVLHLIPVFALCLPGCSGSTGSVEKTRGLVVLNVLDTSLYDDCHIKGSLSVPLDMLDQRVATLDKDEAEVVIYCSNYMCTASGFVSKKLKAEGFKKVWAYEGGMAEWYQLGFPYEGPARSAYLSKANPQPAVHQQGVDVITAELLYEKMKKGGIAKW